MKGEIFYKFAKSSSGDVICVDNLTNDDRKQNYACLSCENKLIPVMGDEKEWHFRHFADTACSGETYRHKLGKEVFYKTYVECLKQKKPFEIKFPITSVCIQCQIAGHDLNKSCHFNTNEVLDLTEEFIEIHQPEQARDGKFTPDVLLSNGEGDKIYIEIVATHESTEQKIMSGVKIIEIYIGSETDLEKINECYLGDSPKIKFINFPKSKRENKESPNRCYFDFFVVENNGRCHMINQRLGFIRNDTEDGEYFYYKYLPRVDRYEYFKELENVFRQYPKKIRNCFLCRYHGQNEWKEKDSKPIFCKFLKKAFSQHEAVKCQSYVPDQIVFPARNYKDMEADFDFEK